MIAAALTMLIVNLTVLVLAVYHFALLAAESWQLGRAERRRQRDFPSARVVR